MTNTASKVTPIESKQPAPAARFQIAATIDGFPITIEVEGKADILRAMIDRLKAIGAQPPQVAAPVEVEPTKPAGVRTCPVHGSAMKEGRRGFYCPKKVGDGYCKETA
jgi:hypothetical protein